MKNLIIYDNGGESIDRYTIINKYDRTGRKAGSLYEYNCIGSSINGRGFFIWTTCYRGRHLGKQVKFEDLNNDLQERIKLAYH